MANLDCVTLNICYQTVIMLRLYRDISQFDRKCNGKKLCSQNSKVVYSFNAILYAMIFF